MSCFRAILLTTVASSGALGALSCSQSTKYSLLTFFFQGVPEPGTTSDTAAPEGDHNPLANPLAANRGFKRPVLVKPRLNWHPPYRTNQCTHCHDVYRGKLVITPEDGLCVSCHTDPPGDRAFIHGPVANNACLLCHHHHVSARPRLLLDEVNALCLSCHDFDDLFDRGDHHATLESETPPTCVQCHDPHGGGNKFFLKTLEN